MIPSVAGEDEPIEVVTIQEELVEAEAELEMIAADEVFDDDPYQVSGAIDSDSINDGTKTTNETSTIAAVLRTAPATPSTAALPSASTAALPSASTAALPSASTTYSYYMATQHLIPPVCPYTTTLLSAR